MGGACKARADGNTWRQAKGRHVLRLRVVRTHIALGLMFKGENVAWLAVSTAFYYPLASEIAKALYPSDTPVNTSNGPFSAEQAQYLDERIGLAVTNL